MRPTNIVKLTASREQSGNTMIQQKTNYKQMKTYMKILILTLVGGILIFTLCSRHKKNKSMNEKFVWRPGIGAPNFYPMEVVSAYMPFGNGYAIPVPGNIVSSGLGSSGGGSVVLGDNVKYSVPVGLDVTWLSITEHKMFEGSFEFPKETIAKHLSESYDTFKNKATHYDEIVATLLPGGRVLLYLSGMGRCIAIDTVYQAKEIKVLPITELFPRGSYSSVQEYIDRVLKNNPEISANLQANGISYELWDTYLKRYNYNIVWEFDNAEETVFDGAVYHFVNGEYYRTEQYSPIIMKTMLKNFSAVWYVGETRYAAAFYFREKEITEVFSQIVSSDTPMTLLIKVCKYNNLFDISLKTDTNEIIIENTQIHVFKRMPSDTEGQLIYDNYRGERPVTFKGQ